MAKVSAKSKAYVESLKALYNKIPYQLAGEVAARVFEKMVWETRLDSGQAVLNWKASQYTGVPVTEGPELIWGYGGIAPTGGAGYKWSKVPDETIRTDLIGQRLVQAETLGQGEFDGIVIYNPIDLGAFPNFSPGTDIFYEIIALGGANAKLAEIESASLSEAEVEMARRYNFLRAV